MEEEPKYRTDAEYVALAERLFQQRLRLCEMETEAQHFELVWAAKGCSTGDRAARRAAVRELVADVAAEVARLEHVLLAPLQQGHEHELKQPAHWEPRTVRVARRYGLGARELLGLLFVLVWNAGTALAPLPAAGTDARRQQLAHALCRACAMTTAECVAFVGAARAHVRDDVFAVESDDAFRFESAFLEMRGSVVRALLGVPLTAEELLAVDQTPLGDVLNEDHRAGIPVVADAFPCSSTTTNTNSRKTRKKHNSSGDDDDDDDPNKEEAERILKELGISADDSADEADSGDDDEKNDDDRETKEEEKEEQEEETEDKEEEEDDAATGLEIDLPEYKDDLEYLEDEFKALAARVLERQGELQDAELGALARDKRNPETVRRELAARCRLQRARVAARLRRTSAVRPGWEPRVAVLVRERGLCAFERDVLLLVVGWAVSSELQQAVRRVLGSSSGSSISMGTGSRTLTVDAVLAVLCATLAEAVACRQYFYRSARLVAEDLVQLHEPAFFARSSGDVLDYGVSVDRRLFDHVIGLDTALGDTLDGSELFAPQVGLDAVVLPAATKARILAAVAHYERWRAACHTLGFDATVPYGRGLCLLFFGPSGTGKTLTAHAVAHHLGKRVLQVNVPATGDGTVSREALRLLFREAKTHNAVVFFDECEHLFEARSGSSRGAAADTGALLTELERGDALVVLATNRHAALDPAVHRRISLAVEFALPDCEQRRAIWRQHVPAGLALAPDVDWAALAMDYELSGGLIKNAVLAAVAHALARDDNNDAVAKDAAHDGPTRVCVCQGDLVAAAREQLHGHLRLGALGDDVATPHRPLARLVAPAATHALLRALVRLERARKVLLHGRWGFADTLCARATTVAVVAGPPGTGKHLAAEAVAYELGRPLHEVSCGEIAAAARTAGTPRLLEGLFRDARGSGAVLVLSDADAVFAPTASTLGAPATTAAAQAAQLTMRIVLNHMTHYGGLVFVLCNTTSDRDEKEGNDDKEDEEEGEKDMEKRQRRARARLAHVLDAQLLRVARFTVLLDTLGAARRAQLWRELVPAATPLAPDVDLARLAQTFALSGGAMLAALLRACEAAVLDGDGGAPLTMQALVDACRAEQASIALCRPAPPPSMYQ